MLGPRLISAAILIPIVVVVLYLGQPWLGLFITSLSFGMGHTLQGNDAAIITGTLGAIWGAMYLTRRSALASIVSHSLFNSGELLRIFLR